jgi:signal transduction histidine kinase
MIDIPNVLFSYFENFTGWLYKHDLIKNWFNIISWVALTSVIFVLYEKSKSLPLFVVAAVSMVLIVFYSFHSVAHAIRLYVNENRKYKWLLILVSFVLGGIVPVFIMLYMVEVIRLALSAGS